MKRSKCLAILLFTIAIFGFLSLAQSQEWHTANQATITWDAVTELQGGIAIPEDDIIEYRVYLVNALTDPDKENPAEIGTTAEIIYVITLNVEGKYFVGLQTIRKSADGICIGESIIGWADDPVIAANGAIFGLQYFLPPDVPHGVRIYD
jgi:hypothetical protein